MIAISLVALLCAVWVAVAQYLAVEPGADLIVVNESTNSVKDIVILLTSPTNGKTQRIEIETLHPYYATHNEIRVAGNPKLEMDYNLNGRNLKHLKDCIDLRPEHFVIGIDKDGVCSGGYWP